MSNSGMISYFRFQCPEVKFNLWRKAWRHHLKLRSHSMQSKPSNQCPLPSCISSCNTIIRNEKYMRVKERKRRLSCNDLPHWFPTEWADSRELNSLFCGCPSGQKRFLGLKRIWGIGQMTVFFDCIFNSTDSFKWFYIRDITIGILGNTSNDDILVTCYIFIKTKALTTFLHDKCGNLEQWKLKIKVLTLNDIWPSLNSIMDSIDSWRDPFQTRPL